MHYPPVMKIFKHVRKLESQKLPLYTLLSTDSVVIQPFYTRGTILTLAWLFAVACLFFHSRATFFLVSVLLFFHPRGLQKYINYEHWPRESVSNRAQTRYACPFSPSLSSGRWLYFASDCVRANLVVATKSRLRTSEPSDLGADSWIYSLI